MPFKIFTNGTILTDSDLNDYLMEQSVITCTSGTRPASPVNGMLIYETDTSRYSAYSTAYPGWVTMGTTVVGSYTPTLTASTTSPNIGTTGTAEGRLTIWNGKWCAIRGSIQWGGSGVTAGSGQYLIALPFTSSSQIANGVSTVGNIMLRDASGGPALRTGACYISAGAATMAMFEATTGGVTNAVPWTWGGVGDYISFSIVYEFA